MGIKSKELMPGKGIGKVGLVVKLKKSVFRAKEKSRCFCPVRFTEGEYGNMNSSP
jgi:hypothetical protein